MGVSDVGQSSLITVIGAPFLLNSPFTLACIVVPPFALFTSVE